MSESIVFCGIDVSSKKLDVCIEFGSSRESGTFENTPQGHQQLISRLTKRVRSSRVALEATGVYGFELSLALHRAKRVEVMVVNPRSSSDFARALMKRSKTDPVDAATLLEYVKRMPFTEWTAPSEQVVELQRVTRHIQANVRSRIQERNRMHALRRVPGSEVVLAEVASHIEFLDESTQRLRDRALEIVGNDPRLAEMLRHATSIKGIGIMSGLTIVAELASLPADMTPRQWVAHAGLDPRRVESGTSVNQPVRISRAGNVHLRCALYMPAIVAMQHEPSVKAFYQKLIGRGKKPMVAVVAIMRKLLHALHGMLHRNADFDGAKFHAVAA